MGKVRKVPSCPPRVKEECPNDSYCRAKVFTPRRADGPKGLSTADKRKSALKSMQDANKGRSAAKKYRPIRDKNGNMVSAKDGKSGHILGYACYQKTEHQKSFAEDNAIFTEAFRDAAKQCTKENGYETAAQRRRCIKESIESNPLVREEMNLREGI